MAVIPVATGIQVGQLLPGWIPAYAGMTEVQLRHELCRLEGVVSSWTLLNTSPVVSLGSSPAAQSAETATTESYTPVLKTATNTPTNSANADLIPLS
ncbi:MAG TPA: hypothetical protein V6C46_07060 [Coleofasciculaceae cyanobacterium]